ncbi:Phospho-N-acetylmuramoyl-pentapeptide-transferase [Desulfotomaculum arcticum]|uniref:Phospho-N-acetylmuramoyl-pentapeptide-transferase n=1 Tax=Desulfotruncus arcticus DSM 17038 TaxID=1121424 RepID=A0A1I2QHE0_9FIRM|nr:phospho-N-acetylmuramoyl-pentapeptide-transferase [Desulfotruncus arcticus]SFG27822.1 Phospho-N-acetylmuramoyl-pentapeptide-transferase [Desulfotomaculum arcticum] [Desulfotruncus arcticus DSM 17038]
MEVVFSSQILTAFIIALVVSLVLGPLVIPLLRRLKFGQSIRNDGPSRHLSKAGTPTMGGVIFIISSIASGLVVGWGDRDALLVLGALLGFGLIGFIDDYIKVALKRSLGLRAREKLLGQFLLAAMLVVLTVTVLDRGTAIAVPFSKIVSGHYLILDWGPWFYLVFSATLIVGMANAVNFTDGLDGLAAGVTTVSALTFVLVGLLSGKSGVALAMAALAGGCIGFLFYNRYPARVFMGDTGSLALGGALGAASLITGSELLLLVIGGVFVLEVASVILQVFSFQVFGRRIFRMSPLHHHFELGGWSEVRVVRTFWIVAILFAVVGMAGFR